MLAVALAGVALATPSAAAEWGTIAAGASTMESVRAHYGPATRSVSQKVEGYDTVSWIYESAQAPAGIRRLTVDFGLLTPAGYRPEVVRVFKLEPVPGVFRRATIFAGWGAPTRIGREGETEIFFYPDGLLVYFDRTGEMAETLVFLPPQPAESGGERRP